MYDATRWTVSAATGNGSPDEILSNWLAQEDGVMYAETHYGKWSINEMPSSVRQRTLAARVKKSSLYFDYLKTTDEMAPVGYDMKWPPWTPPVQRYCVY
jgi:hypothetical protein